MSSVFNNNFTHAIIVLRADYSSGSCKNSTQTINRINSQPVSRLTAIYSKEYFSEFEKMRLAPPYSQK